MVMLIATLAGGCASVDKMVETGNYDQAIYLAQKRLSGKQNKNPKLVRALEIAFNKAVQRDMDIAQRLQEDGAHTDWGRVYGLYSGIQGRQEALAPLLPLIDKQGYKASFRFVKVDELVRNSRDNAAAQRYDQALALLKQAENGDHLAARSAYRKLEEVNEYVKNYRNTAELQRKAHTLGTTYILVEVRNEANIVAPKAFEQRLQQLNPADFNSFWQEYHLQPATGQTYDYRIVMRINQISIGPDLVKEREYEDAKEIEDGFEYVLDDRGNVKKDSLGNDIKVPKKVTVKAWVLEVHQQKAADVKAEIQVIDLARNQVIKSQPLGATAFFENYFASFRGDERALSKDSKRSIGNRPLPFPSTETLILQAADQLKPALRDKLVDYRDLI
jgi:hypothetical protein